MTASPLVRLEAASRSYGGRAALLPIDLAIGPGEIVALAGPNGAGKTTLLSLVAGSLAPTSGRVATTGRVGFVPQEAALYPVLTARENVELFARLDGYPDAPGAAASVLADCGLDEFADRRAGALSIGQRQRINVAIGLLGSPDVVLLDEPSSSLDPRQRRLVWELLGRICGRGGAVLFTTQNVEEVHLHASSLVVLVDGRLAFQGSVAAFEDAVGVGADGFEGTFVRFLEGQRPG
jgi:ABC-2 type transport system ATP-binding protein